MQLKPDARSSSVKRPEPCRPPCWQSRPLAAHAVGAEPGEAGRGSRPHLQQVQKYEKGTNRIGASRLQQIAQFLKVEIAYFLTAYRRKSSRVASPKKVPPMSSIF